MDDTPVRSPDGLERILARTAELGFGMACETRTGALLRSLASMLPGGRLVELGTGTGAGTAWLLAGMASDARLITIDNDPAPQAVAHEVLGHDPRLEIVTEEATDWLDGAQQGFADLVFADAWVGKFEMLDASLALLRPGGLWIGDDLLPQPNWPEGHAPRVPDLLDRLAAKKDYMLVTLAWASGLALVTRIA